MARVRSINPKFFKDDQLAELPASTRLFFIGLWCMADHRGRLEDRPKRLRAEILPYDDASGEEMLKDLESIGKIKRYTVDGRKLLWLPAFTKYQFPNVKEKATPSEYPAHPEETEPEQAQDKPKATPTPKQAQCKHSASTVPEQSGNDASTAVKLLNCCTVKPIPTDNNRAEQPAPATTATATATTANSNGNSKGTAEAAPPVGKPAPARANNAPAPAISPAAARTWDIIGAACRKFTNDENTRRVIAHSKLRTDNPGDRLALQIIGALYQATHARHVDDPAAYAIKAIENFICSHGRESLVSDSTITIAGNLWRQAQAPTPHQERKLAAVLASVGASA